MRDMESKERLLEAYERDKDDDPSATPILGSWVIEMEGDEGGFAGQIMMGAFASGDVFFSQTSEDAIVRVGDEQFTSPAGTTNKMTLDKLDELIADLQDMRSVMTGQGQMV